MTKATTIFEVTGEIGLKFIHAPEYLSYCTRITIKSNGKNPITLELKFNGIPPYAAPMPPENHKITSENISALFCKINRWAKKYGYTIHY